MLMTNALRLRTNALNRWWRLAVWMIFAACPAIAWGQAQDYPVHFQYPVGIPPGVVGTQRLARGGPVPGYFQPVEIKTPAGSLISVAEGGAFLEPQRPPVRLGLLIGQVYRICVLNIPFHAGQEVFPTIEMIDRVYPPAGQEARFPVRIELTLDDLKLALDGKFVTKVVYLEDPKRAIPAPSAGKEQSWFEVPSGRDPLAVAGALGRPMAIVRLGGRVPDLSRGLDPQFLFGCPPLVKFTVEPPQTKAMPSPAQVKVMPAPPSRPVSLVSGIGETPRR